MAITIDDEPQSKIAHYRDLIEQGLDCDGHPVDPVTTLQREGVSR
jgi:hypothetical protein